MLMRLSLCGRIMSGFYTFGFFFCLSLFCKFSKNKMYTPGRIKQ